MENLDIKIMQLDITTAKMNVVLDAGTREAIERQLSTLKSITTEMASMRIEVEAKKLVAKETMTDIEKWNTQRDPKLGEADNEVSKVWKWFDEQDKQAEILAQEEKLTFEGKLHQTKMELQAQFQATLQNQHPPVHQTPSNIHVKLPKLVITKFDGNFMDWPRFWGQFTKTIDKTSLPATMEFSCLRELLDTSVKRTLKA